MFFGRASLIAQVMGRDPANYLIVGGRQVGKSSLLKNWRGDSRRTPELPCTTSC
jgi:predicted AAA+ superfamily ATPase